MTTYAEALEAAHQERTAILGRLANAFDAMRLDSPPTMTPFTSEGSAPAFAEATRAALQSGDTTVLAGVLEASEAPEGVGYSDDTTPVVILSLNGLRRIESLVTELQQRREVAEA